MPSTKLLDEIQGILDRLGFSPPLKVYRVDGAPQWIALFDKEDLTMLHSPEQFCETLCRLSGRADTEGFWQAIQPYILQDTWQKVEEHILQKEGDDDDDDDV